MSLTEKKREEGGTRRGGKGGVRKRAKSKMTEKGKVKLEFSLSFQVTWQNKSIRHIRGRPAVVAPSWKEKKETIKQNTIRFKVWAAPPRLTGNRGGRNVLSKGTSGGNGGERYERWGVPPGFEKKDTASTQRQG